MSRFKIKKIELRVYVEGSHLNILLIYKKIKDLYFKDNKTILKRMQKCD